MKTALVHDYLAQAGGAERVAAAFHALFPEAPLYTSVYDPAATLPSFAGMDIRTSFLQRWPFSSRRFHKLALPYYPAAFERFNFSGYDLVLSSSSSFAKGIITPPETCHVCYCHTPSRFVWRQQEYLSQRSAYAASSLVSAYVNSLRSWDVESAQRVDYFVANSYNVARRIRKFYHRDVAAVIYPPVETTKFHSVDPAEIGCHFLVVSRLLNYKRIDLAVEACTRRGLPLRVVGIGPDLARLKRLAGPTIQFLGRLPDEQVVREMARCKALIFPGEEDFGITPVECMASGRPVIAYGAGGALETVVDQQTGLFFPEQTVDSLVHTLEEFNAYSFDPAVLKARASCFDTSVFEKQILMLVAEALEEHRQNNSIACIDRKSLAQNKSHLPLPRPLTENFNLAESYKADYPQPDYPKKDYPEPYTALPQMGQNRV